MRAVSARSSSSSYPRDSTCVWRWRADRCRDWQWAQRVGRALSRCASCRRGLIEAPPEVHRKECDDLAEGEKDRAGHHVAEACTPDSI